MHTDPDWRNCEPVLPFHSHAPHCSTINVLQAVQNPAFCLLVFFICFIRTNLRFALALWHQSSKIMWIVWPQGVFCVWTRRLNCAPVFSTFFLLSIGQDRGIVLRETYYISVSKPCAAELLALREANCAATTGSVQAGSVRCFQARLFYSNRRTVLRRGSHPGGLADAAGQGFGFWFPFLF